LRGLGASPNIGEIAVTQPASRRSDSAASATRTSHNAETSWWAHALIGVALVLAGIYVIGNAVAATLLTVALLGTVLVAVGLFEMVASFWTKGWGRFLLNLIVGAVYAAAGAVVMYNPLAASAFLTLAFSIALIIAGVVRIGLAFRFWSDLGWLLMLSGIVGVLAGFVILGGWPVTGLWVFGMVLGIDFLTYGVFWLAYAFTQRRSAAANLVGT
jgi:uncharacterized membrane protein HdeD (DUF308 family)